MPTLSGKKQSFNATVERVRPGLKEREADPGPVKKQKRT